MFIDALQNLWYIDNKVKTRDELFEYADRLLPSGDEHLCYLIPTRSSCKRILRRSVKDFVFLPPSYLSTMFERRKALYIADLLFLIVVSLNLLLYTLIPFLRTFLNLSIHLNEKALVTKHGVLVVSKRLSNCKTVAKFYKWKEVYISRLVDRIQVVRIMMRRYFRPVCFLHSGNLKELTSWLVKIQKEAAERRKAVKDKL
eukprot:snap_masked-scaffold_2-processed-gene-27.21-mRNA-1 protein AED:1.00 eAED:1.00 QI:0/0/0/0/1/1/2/0/199